MAVKRTKKELGILAECREVIKKHPKLKRRKLTKIKNLEKRLFYLKVWAITESNPLHKLRHFKKRGFSRKQYHLDHIFPISIAFVEGIPPEVVGDMRNLRFILGAKNIKKGNTVTYRAKLLINEIKKSKGIIN